MKKTIEQPYLIAVLLLIVSLFSYGAMILRPGFFGEDVSQVWLYQRGGLSALQAYFGEGQSIAALFTNGLLAVGGMQALVYQLPAVLLRWLGAWAFWLLVKEIWPGNDGKALLAALIFLVFPGMKHNPLAISILPHLLALALTILGFQFLYHGMVEKKRRSLHLIGAWLTGISLLLSHYFIGLEILRLGLIWRGWSREKGIGRKDLIKKTVLTWLPYAFFLVIRFILGLSGRGRGEAVSLTGAAKTIIRDLLDMLILGWRQIFQFPTKTGELSGYLLAVAISGLLVFWILRKPSTPNPPRKKEEKTAQPMRDGYLWIGLLAVAAGGLPVWIGNETLSLGYPDSIAALALLPGTALLIAGVIDLVLLPRFQAALAAGLLALTIGAQVQNTATFVKEWERAGTLVQQLHNRLPALEEGTLLISEQLPLDYFSEEQMSALLNLAYFPDRQRELDGLMYMDAASAQEISPEEGLVESAQNGFRFTGSLSRSIAFYQPEKGCLRVLRAGEVDPEGLPFTLGQVLEITGPDSAISNEKPALLPLFFDSIPELDRCSTLQRIEANAEQGDWDSAREAMEKAGPLLRKVDAAHELVPLVETAAHSGQAGLMEEIAREAIGAEGGPFELCRAFERIDQAADVSKEVKTAVEALKAQALCENYD